MLFGPKAHTIDVLCACIYAHVCFIAMAYLNVNVVYFSFIYFSIYGYINIKDFGISYVLASTMFHSGTCFIKRDALFQIYFKYILYFSVY